MPEAAQKSMQSWMAWMGELDKKGHLKDRGQPLERTGKVVRGQERSVILGCIEDGPNLVTLAMNGWGEGEPAWWLNLQAHPQARVQLSEGSRQVVANAATGQERAVAGPVADTGQESRRPRPSPTDTDGRGGPQTRTESV